MKNRVKALLATCVLFLLGSLAGFAATSTIQSLSNFLVFLIEARMLGPVRTASGLSDLAVATLVFANNSVPVLLAFLYPVTIARISWNPPMSLRTRKKFLMYFSLLAGFLLGFFNLGSVLGVSFRLGGTVLVSQLMSRVWLHGPIEFGLVILALSESFWLSTKTRRIDLLGAIRNDIGLLVACLVGLVISAIIEVFLGV